MASRKSHIRAWVVRVRDARELPAGARKYRLSNTLTRADYISHLAHLTCVKVKRAYSVRPAAQKKWLAALQFVTHEELLERRAIEIRHGGEHDGVEVVLSAEMIER